MPDRPHLDLVAVVLGTPDPDGLARFYTELLGWERATDEPDWVTLHAPEGRLGLSFQTEENHVPPTWPAGPGDQQMQAHLDIEVADLAAAEAHALAAGAVRAAHQPQEDVRVYLDPDGHPFCLFNEEDGQ